MGICPVLSLLSPSGSKMTLADLACYSELGQLLPAYQNLWDFGPTANVQKWCSRMAAVPYHDDVMLANKLLGDASALHCRGDPFPVDSVVLANKEGIKRFASLVEDMSA